MNGKRDKLIAILFTTEEKKQIEERAKDKGLTATSYARMTILQKIQKTENY